MVAANHYLNLNVLFFEPRFGVNFGQVRVHTGTQAAESAQVLNARAYTLGQDVVFGEGQYAPGTAVGRRLLAHELTHVVQQSAAEPTGKQAPHIKELSPAQAERSEAQAWHTARNAVGGLSVESLPFLGAGQYLQKVQVGARVTHPEGRRSRYRCIEMEFDGREFIVNGDGTEALRASAQSGRPRTVLPEDAGRCGGSSTDSYMNNPRYVGVADNGPIPEGEYRFRVTEIATFSEEEQDIIFYGGEYIDPFGRRMHGGDWGSGRVPLHPVSGTIRPSPVPACGNTARRRGFYLHGGIMPGSSGCIDIGNDAFSNLVELLLGYRGLLTMRVRYQHPAPYVGPIGRALGGFTYPRVEEPGVLSRIGAALSEFFAEPGREYTSCIERCERMEESFSRSICVQQCDRLILITEP
uniref:eCIS core domain-containing protein n=1 Tax=Candidatus Methanophagaceae archaeon ANME-1 ERB6 TaxID=2759912 RepID=A0A7G9YSN2_9EURY|nr:hypothetical protein EDLMLJLI_00009 [Methanosarcinales archaeon ANME-1 ERB6]